MNRITDKHLQIRLDELNRLLGRPLAPYSVVDGKSVAQIGNYHLSFAYGGTTVLCISNSAGGCSHAFGLYGHVTKREVMQALDGAVYVARLMRETVSASLKLSNGVPV